MIFAIFGCIFGILGIFTIGIVFVPLAALCALFGLLSGLAKQQFSTALMAIVAGILAAVGWVTSPSLWLVTAVMLAPTIPSAPAARAGGALVDRDQGLVADQIIPSTHPPSMPAVAETAPIDPDFQRGKRDRLGWENFFADVVGDQREGASWWAGQRSLKNSGSCSKGHTVEFRDGCEKARAILGPIDVLRRTSATYRSGWNSY